MGQSRWCWWLRGWHWRGRTRRLQDSKHRQGHVIMLFCAGCERIGGLHEPIRPPLLRGWGNSGHFGAKFNGVSRATGSHERGRLHTPRGFVEPKLWKGNLYWERYACEWGPRGPGFSLRRGTGRSRLRGEWTNPALPCFAVRQRANSSQYLTNSLAAILCAYECSGDKSGRELDSISTSTGKNIIPFRRQVKCSKRCAE